MNAAPCRTSGGTRSSCARAGVALLAVAAAQGIAGCGSASTDDEASARATAAIIGGRSSTESENHAVRIEHESGFVCSGTLVAPRIVLTARHCLVRVTPDAFECKPNGEISDPTNPSGQNVQLTAPDKVQVRVGIDTDASGTAKAVALLAPPELSLCRNDVAVIVLERPLADIHVPIRRTPARVGERVVVAGWGLTTDSTASVTKARRAIDDLKVDLVGPGAIPHGSFAVRGGSLCFGDSGAGALTNGALLGIFSRHEGGSCELLQSRNLFDMTAPHTAFFEEAFARGGERPWYEGEPKPWLLPDGGACASDEACRSERCDGERRVCASRCTPGASSSMADASAAGAGSCSANESCDEARHVCVTKPVTAAAPAGAASCALHRSDSTSARCALLLLAIAASLSLTRRARR